MITEDYVSFETAKLLKEKGFDWESFASIKVFRGHRYEVNEERIVPEEDTIIPTLQMAMKWLREVKKLNCIVDVSFNQKRNGESEYYFCVWENKPPYELLRESPIFSIYEEACEAAIKYCLENLI